MKKHFSACNGFASWQLGRIQLNLFWLGVALLGLLLSIFPLSGPAKAMVPTSEEGLSFVCPDAELAVVEPEVDTYLQSLGVSLSWVHKHKHHDTLTYTLATAASDTSTLDLAQRNYDVGVEEVQLPASKGRTTTVQTVSRKEIALALLQHGRLTTLQGSACNAQALKEHIELRQNTVAWAERLEWDWPDGGAAKWNKRYWNKGTPRPGAPLSEAVNDAFVNQAQYGIGCYTATKLVFLQGVLDYYRRVHPNPEKLAMIEARLRLGGEPLEDVEPGRMWSFEKDFDNKELTRPGKLLSIQYHVAPQNFVPGDWLYFLNTDEKTYQKTGYEGSNAIYLGRNRFDDYYNDNHHAYAYRQKLDEVYQWRNGVFSRIRDAAKVKPLTDADVLRLSAPPSEGGLLNDFRVIPYFFGYAALPALHGG